jgi:hypothetical protein
MYRLFLVLKDRDEPPTDDEIAIASGKKTLDPTKAAEYLVKLEKASATLVDAFAKQNQQAKLSSTTPNFPDTHVCCIRILKYNCTSIQMNMVCRTAVYTVTRP